MKSQDTEEPSVWFSQTVKVVLASASVGVPLISPLLTSSVSEAGKSGAIA